jgi:hypothetical protein
MYMKLSQASRWQVERAHCEEGLQNPDDLYDATTMKDIREEADRMHVGLEVMVDRTLSDTSEQTLRDLQECTRTMSEAFQVAFHELLDRYQQERAKIPPKVIQYLLERGHDLPKFMIFDAGRGEEYLASQGFSCQIHAGGFVLLFQLPKPLAYFWFKGPYNDEDGERVDLTRGEVTEWGWFNNQVLSVIWQGVDDSETFRFERINGFGQHAASEYYYLWEVWPKQGTSQQRSSEQESMPESGLAA